MIVNVLPDADPPYAFVEGIESDQALSILVRAVMDWYAFGWYNHVIVDLTSFDDWSARVVERLATATSNAASAGHWLAFFPVGTNWLRGADADFLPGYPDRAHAERAIQQKGFAAAKAAKKHHWDFKRRYRA